MFSASWPGHNTPETTPRVPDARGENYEWRLGRPYQGLVVDVILVLVSYCRESGYYPKTHRRTHNAPTKLGLSSYTRDREVAA